MATRTRGFPLVGDLPGWLLKTFIRVQPVHLPRRIQDNFARYPTSPAWTSRWFAARGVFPANSISALLRGSLTRVSPQVMSGFARECTRASCQGGPVLEVRPDSDWFSRYWCPVFGTYPNVQDVSIAA